MLAPIPLRTSRSYELQDGVAATQARRSRRVYHHVRRSASSVRELTPLSELGGSRPANDHGSADRLQVEVKDQAGQQEQEQPRHQRQRVSRRYFFRGLEGCSDFPAAAHFDCILKLPDNSELRSESPRRGSFPVTPPDQPDRTERRERRERAEQVVRCDYVDTLVNSVEACEARGSGSVKVAAEDLSAIISDARPYGKDDARPMCVLFQELLRRLTAGTLDIVGNEAEKLAGELRRSHDDNAALRTQLDDHESGIVVKLRRVEGRLAAERKAAKLLQKEHDALAKEKEQLLYRLRKYEPDPQAKADAMSRARSMLAMRGGFAEDIQSAQLRRLKSFLSHVALFGSLDDDELGVIAAQLQQVTFSDGCDIVVEGDHGDALYIVDEGKAVATKRSIVDEHGEPRVLMAYETGDWFGELALLGGGQKRAATVCAVGEVKCLQLPRSAFEEFLQSAGKCEDILKRDQEKYTELLRKVASEGQDQKPSKTADESVACRVRGSMDFLAELSALPGGLQCADCRESNPCWGSSNTGALLCLSCSGIHRMLGEESSKVLSVKLDSWEPDEVATMRKRGNAALNELLERCLKPEDKPKPWSTREDIEDFIYSKYVLKNFVEGGSGTIEEPPWVRRVAVPSEVTNEQAAQAFLQRMQSGELSEDELRVLGAAFLQHAESHQLQELLESFMGDERACEMMSKMVLEHERQSKLSGLMTKATGSITAQLKLSSELNRISEASSVEEEADAAPSGIGAAAALKGSMQAMGLAGSMASAFAVAHDKRKAGLKKGLRASVMGAGQIMGLQQIAADAHARDFTIKQWHKHTKALSGTALYDALHPPVQGFPCEKAMKLSSMKKLVSKIYEAFACEFFDGSGNGRGGGGKQGGRGRPPLHEYVEDCLLLQYGMPSLARKTLLQMVATVHKHQATDSRVRVFAELVGMVPPRSEMTKMCCEQAQDFYLRFLTMIYPARKISDSMSSVRTSGISIGEAECFLGVIYPGMLPLEVTEELSAMSETTAKGVRVISVDLFLELVMRMWSDMAYAQKDRLEALFETHDDGDGQLSFSEFAAVIHAATADTSQSDILDLYKRCLAQSQSDEEGDEGEEEEDDDGNEEDEGMDAIKPEAFLQVVLPHVLRSMQQTL
jgi:CRP-like cAMP-binding protein